MQDKRIGECEEVLGKRNAKDHFMLSEEIQKFAKNSKEYDANSTKSSSGRVPLTEENEDRQSGGLAVLGVIDKKLLIKGKMPSKPAKKLLQPSDSGLPPGDSRTKPSKKQAHKPQPPKSVSFEAVLDPAVNRKLLKKTN